MVSVLALSPRFRWHLSLVVVKDFQKRIKKPSYDDVTALIHQCLVIRASRHGELTVSKAWTNSEGLSWIATIFPDLTSLLFRRHPSEDNFGLVPLAANGQYLRVVSGFEGAAFVDRTASAKSAWDKKILRFGEFLFFI